MKDGRKRPAPPPLPLAPLPLVFCLLILPTIAAADEISTLTPSSFQQFSTEEFVTIAGTGLQGTETTEVVFSGPGGTFTVAPSTISDTELFVFVPDTVLQV